MTKDFIRIDLETCTNCERCVSICPASALSMGPEHPEMTKPEACTRCGICEDQCPAHAIKLLGRKELQIDGEIIEKNPVLARFSDDLVCSLDMKKEPVGVKLIRNGFDIPISFHRIEFPIRHCVSINTASMGASLHVPFEMHACAAAKAALGMQDLPDKVKSGKVPYMHGLACCQEAAARTMREIPKLPLGSSKGTLVGPIQSFSKDPDVVILVVKPKQAMWIANSLIFHGGGPRITANFAGMQASCADVTAIPIKTGDVNFSLGCYGCRSVGKLRDEEMYVGIPFEKLESVINGLKGLKRAIGKLEDSYRLQKC